MTLYPVPKLGLCLISVLLVAVVPFTTAVAASTGDDVTVDEQAGDAEVQHELDEQLAERRKAMLDEADAALRETNLALKALDEGDSGEALEALARATGKLELLIARDPDLALAPVDTEFITHDLYASPEAIRLARDEAQALLEAGRVQEARALLSNLASEIVIRVTNLPLATYPDAIKAISPLIDAGRAEEAKSALHTALSTLVVTRSVISLPIARARAALREAETMLEAEDLSDDEKGRIQERVADARRQVEMAELLGYGEKQDYEEYREQIAELETKIRGEKETRGVFARLRKSLDDFQASFFE